MTLRETIARALRAMAPPETKSSRTAQLVHFESGGRARWTPRDYGALAREGFLKNAIVHRSVKLVAENVAAASLILYDGPHPLDAHPLLNLLARPNPREDRAGFLEAVAADLLIAGNAYIEAVSAAGEESASVRELYALRPDRMKVVPGADGWPRSYEYSVGAQTVRFSQEAALPPILHLKLFHPLDDHYGLAPLEAAAVPVELSLIECPLFCFTLLHALWTGSPSSIEGFGSLSGLLMAYFGARFGVLGVYVSGRSREKLAAATGDISPGAIADAAKSIFKKK